MVFRAVTARLARRSCQSTNSALKQSSCQPMPPHRLLTGNSCTGRLQRSSEQTMALIIAAKPKTVASSFGLCADEYLHKQMHPAVGEGTVALPLSPPACFGALSSVHLASCVDTSLAVNRLSQAYRAEPQSFRCQPLAVPHLCGPRHTTVGTLSSVSVHACLAGAPATLEVVMPIDFGAALVNTLLAPLFPQDPTFINYGGAPSQTCMCSRLLCSVFAQMLAMGLTLAPTKTSL